MRIRPTGCARLQTIRFLLVLECFCIEVVCSVGLGDSAVIFAHVARLALTQCHGSMRWTWAAVSRIAPSTESSCPMHVWEFSWYWRRPACPSSVSGASWRCQPARYLSPPCPVYFVFVTYGRCVSTDCYTRLGKFKAKAESIMAV